MPKEKADPQSVDVLTLRAPDDFHVHFREGEALRRVVPYTARAFCRAMVMPNLRPPVAGVEQARQYRDLILAALPEGVVFEPLMTLYLTHSLTRSEIQLAAKNPWIRAVKLYPAGATTHSQAGIQDLSRIEPLLEELEEAGLPLLVHAEVTDSEVDVFDREKVFIDRYLSRWVKKFSALRVVLEHVTTAEGVDFVMSQEQGLAATVTPQHLLWNRNELFRGGLQPHAYCLPVLKREEHRLRIREVVFQGDSRFFLGTDTAPHPRRAKESACGCAGIFSAPVALEIYAQIFEEMGCLGKLEAFASEWGARFYGLPLNQRKIQLVREDWQVPEEFELGTGQSVVPLWAGRVLRWRLSSGGVQ